MTYQEFVSAQEQLKQLEAEYLKAWRAQEKHIRKLRQLSAQMEEIEKAIEESRHFHS